MRAGAGSGALHADAAYEAAGAIVTEHPSTKRTWYSACNRSTPNAWLLCPLGLQQSHFSTGGAPGRHRRPPRSQDNDLRDGVRPRISRAQSMDALSSQAMVVGYRGAIVAAEMLGQFFPLSMTAAGTVPPAPRS